MTATDQITPIEEDISETITIENSGNFDAKIMGKSLRQRGIQRIHLIGRMNEQNNGQNTIGKMP